MEDQRLNIPDSDDSWPAAEAMLDRYFRRKKRRRYGLLLLLLLLTTTAGWLLTDKSTDGFGGKAIRQESGRQPGIEIVTISTDRLLRDKRQPEKISVTENNLINSPAEPINKLRADGDLATSISSFEKDNLHTPLRSTLNKAECSGANQQQEISSVNTLAGTSISAGSYILPMEYLELTIPVPPIAIDDIKMTNRKEESHEDNKSRPVTTLLHVYGGMSQVSHTVLHPGESPYAYRREKEEAPALLPSAGLQWVREGRSWGTRLGAEVAVLGEETGYSPYLFGDYTTTNGVWNPSSYSVTDTDSAYIYGILFYNIYNRNVTDSVYTLVTDTLQGMLYDNSVQEGNGINRKYILQFPVEVSWRLSGGRFTLDAIMGVTPGINVVSRGRYLTRDERGIYHYERSNSRQFTLGAIGGLECGYLLNDRFKVALRAQYRMQLTPYREENGADLIYRTVGLQGGVMYRLR